jgi:hypothetical protein
MECDHQTVPEQIFVKDEKKDIHADKVQMNNIWCAPPQEVH